METTRAYLSCPMENNKAYKTMLDNAYNHFAEKGYIVYRPDKLSEDLDYSWKNRYNQTPQYGNYLINDINHFSEANINLLILLPGWQTSKGCLAEHLIAQCLGIKIIEWCEQGTLFDTQYSKNMVHKMAFICLFQYLSKCDIDNKHFENYNHILKICEESIDNYSILAKREQEGFDFSTLRP